MQSQCKSNDIAAQSLGYYPPKAKTLHSKKSTFVSKTQRFSAENREKSSQNTVFSPFSSSETRGISRRLCHKGKC